jgi:hypothetical protein
MTQAYSFRATFMRFRKDYKLSYQQFFFLWYLFDCKFTEKFRRCDLLVPGTGISNTYYYLKTLKSKGYLKKEGFYYTLTDKAWKNFNEFLNVYKRRIALPFTWK